MAPQSRRRIFVKNATTVLLPVATSVSTAIAALTSGSTRAYISLVAIAATFGTAYLGMAKDRKSANAAAAAQRDLDVAIEAAKKKKFAVAQAVILAGQPIVTQLGKVARAPDLYARRAAVQVLIARVVELASSQCGRFAGMPCETRSSLYRLDPSRRVLVRFTYEGRHGNAPRADFDASRSSIEMSVVDLANSERVLLVTNLDEQRHLVDRAVGYKSFVSVPVRAEGASYGMLSVDSNVAGSLVQTDLGYMILLAGALAAGLAQLGDDPWGVLVQNGAQVPQQPVGPNPGSVQRPPTA